MKTGTVLIYAASIVLGLLAYPQARADNPYRSEFRPGVARILLVIPAS